MQFHANHVSTSTFAGDCYQAMFEADEEADDLYSPYLLIQRQFEDPDDQLCFVETHDEKYIGHFFYAALNSLYVNCQLSSTVRITSSQRYLYDGTLGFRGGIARSEDHRGEIDPQ
jgi:hypothetical protein